MVQTTVVSFVVQGIFNMRSTTLKALPTNIILGWKWLSLTNTLAYNSTVSTVTMIGFIVQDTVVYFTLQGIFQIKTSPRSLY